MAHIYTHPDKKNAWDKCLWKVTDIVILLRCMHPSHLQSSVFFSGLDAEVFPLLIEQKTSFVI